MKTIGIKLADGSFYPVLQDNTVAEKELDLTTAHNNQTTVMVDLYRSASCSMADAEYVDSLQIDNLVAHPNGEPDISFSVSLDENNKLSAKIVDTETGRQSKTTITLVSRTQEERLITDEYDISDSKEKNVKKTAGLVAGGGLLAAASALREREAKENATEVEFTPAADMNFDIPAETETEEPVVETEEAPVPEVEETFEPPVEETSDETSVETNVIEEPVTEDIFAETAVNDIPDDFGIEGTEENTLAEDTTEVVETPLETEADNIFEAPETNLETPDAEEETPVDFTQDQDAVNFDNETINSGEEISTEETEALSDINFDFPGDDSDQVISEAVNFEDLDTTPADETIVEEDPFAVPDSTDVSETVDDSSLSLDLPDFPETSDETIVEDNPFDIPDSTDSISDDSLDLDLPDFPEDTNETVIEDESFAIPDSSDASETIDDSSLSLDLPDFPETSDETIVEDSPFDMPDSTDSISDDSLDLDLPDFPEDTNETVTEDDPFELPDSFNDIDDEPKSSYEAPASSGISFTGLYDKETELGESSSYEEEEVKKKTKVPVIICIICAIICILATVLVLLVIPSKYNLINKKVDARETVVEQPVEVVEEEMETEEEPEPIPDHVPEAKEDEIVVIEKAEEVVPEQPPVAVEKPKDITYKIKWGDTLWDIADTYYKNPWRYKYIARFNKIKNPDHIISGTYITIPAE